MPAKNIVKEYEPGGYYHVYNRGVEKRDIFQDEADYKKFIAFLRFYLTEPNLQGRTLKDEQGKTIPPSRANSNFIDEVVLQAYCLMPNHLHLLIRQVNERSMADFMHSLMTKYVMYFNKKYKRVGTLFQGKYKTVHILSEEQYIYITKYIHRNPLPENPTGSDLEGLKDYKYSSYGNYLKLFSQSWVKTEDILSYFSRTNPRNTYQSFVEETGDIARVYKEMIDFDDE
ncbi:MAG: transposase [bacterium]